MTMFNGKVRLAIVVENTPIAVRFVPHTTDDTLVVIKGQGEAPIAFCKAAGIPCGPLTQGSDFTMVEAEQAKVGEGVAKILGLILDAAEPTHVLKALGPAKCAECGSSDGTHWQFCGLNVKKQFN
jgi:hypothetical protein